MWIKSTNFNLRDAVAGAIFVVIGLFFALNAVFSLRIGHASSMGPGYFPTVLGFILVAFGIAIAASSIGKPNIPFGYVSWRGVGLIMASIIFFAFTIRGLGMAPSLGISVLMAGLSSGKMTLRGAVFLSMVMTVFCVLVFIYALGLPYPVVGHWILGR